MFQFMALTLPTDGPNFSREASEIERFRACHRRLCRVQQQQQEAAAPNSKIEALDVDEGRTRKVSAKWRQKQQQAQFHNQFDDGYWPKSAGTEMHLGFNAFDFSSSPEAFYDDEDGSIEANAHERDVDEVLSDEHPERSVATKREDTEQSTRKQRMATVEKQVTSMGFNSASMWERRFPGLRQPGGPIRQTPTFGQNSGGSVHHATYDGQRQAFYRQPQYDMYA